VFRRRRLSWHPPERPVPASVHSSAHAPLTNGRGIWASECEPRQWCEQNQMDQGLPDRPEAYPRPSPAYLPVRIRGVPAWWPAEPAGRRDRLLLHPRPRYRRNRLSYRPYEHWPEFPDGPDRYG